MSNKNFRNYVSLLCLLSVLVATAKIKVVDATNATPIVGASVFSLTGTMIGTTDSVGYVPDAAEKCESITLRHVAYESQSTKVADVNNGVIELTPRTFALDEINITAGKDRSKMRIECFFRIYSSADADVDKAEELTEGKLSYYLSLGKSDTAYPNVICSKTYVHNLKADKDTFFISSKDDDLNVMLCKQLIQLSTPPIIESKSFAAIDRSLPFDTIQGKRYPKCVYNCGAETATVQVDHLADAKDHVLSPAILKMFGLTTDIDKMFYTETYRKTENDKYTSEDMIGSSMVMSFLGKGRLWKKKLKGNEVRTNIYMEMFVTDITYLSKTEAKEMKKSDENYSGEFEVPDFIPELDAAALQLKSRAESK